uniref:Putative rabb and C n=1 Tax=Schistosoma mansoni TaxID=6183 RepID=A0A3Q0KGU5_SCHMA
MSYSFDLHESIYGSEPYNTTHFKIPSNQTTTTTTTTKKHKQNGYVKQFLQQNGMRKTKKSSPLISVNGTGGGIGEQRFDANFKVLLLGNSGVGKTSIIRALVGETFYQTTISTIGIDLIKRIFTVENHRVQLEVWDTAGQEQYHSIVSLHFREAKCFIIVYDVTDMESFEQIRKYWLRSVDEHMDEAVPVFFVANKIDTIKDKKVSTEQGQQLTSQQAAHGFFETSAKTGKNIQNLFQAVAECMVSTWGAPKRWYEINTEGNNHLDPWSNSYNHRYKDTVQLDQKKAHNKLRCCLTH